MGQAMDCQRYYVYSGKNHTNLLVGSSIIEETLVRETKKVREEEHRQEIEKQEMEGLREKVSCSSFFKQYCVANT